MIACIGIRIPTEKLYAPQVKPRCGHRIPAGNLFCPQCGIQVEIFDGPKKPVDGFDGQKLHGYETRTVGDYTFVAAWFLEAPGMIAVSDMVVGENRILMSMKLGAFWDASQFGVWMA